MSGINRVAIFVDGKLFHRGYRESNREDLIKFPKMSEWLANMVGCDLFGTYYYTNIGSVDSDSYNQLNRFLSMIESQSGYFVRRFEEKYRNVKCLQCQDNIRVAVDRDFDVSFVSEVMSMAANNVFDSIIYVGNNSVYASMLNTLRAMGKQTFIAYWGLSGIPSVLMQSVFRAINLNKGLDEFVVYEDDEREEEEEEVTVSQEQAFLDELCRAEDQFSNDGAYVGLNYFLTKWHSNTELTDSINLRRKVLDILVEKGCVEKYVSDDQSQAIRVTKID